jgi:hypothetical protein
VVCNRFAVKKWVAEAFSPDTPAVRHTIFA